jgi:Mg2+ and Co2+ transporters
MYYQFGDSIKEISINDFNPDLLTLGILTLEELEQSYNLFGFSYLTVVECKNDSQHLHGTLNSYYDYLFGIIIAINPGQIIKIQDRLGIYIKENLLLIVIIEDKDESSKSKIADLLDNINLTKLTQERLIFGLLERFISGDYVLLEKIEEKITSYEDKINALKTDKNFSYQITAIRKELMLLDNYYQQFISIGEELEENSADIFHEENLHYFRVFSSRVERLSNNTRMLQEFCVHVREAYDAQLEYDLNRIMKIFTVVTTIFLPLTLIVGWYGMNFNSMPELTWRFGYVYVIILCIIVAIICIIYFKRKKFM